LIYQTGREVEMSILQSILGPQLRDLERRRQVATVQFTAQQSEVSPSAAAASAGGERLPTRPLSAEALERNDPWLVQPVAGIAIILLLFNVTGLGSSILEEKESGTLPRLLQALPRPESFFGAKLLFGALISAVQLSIMLLFAHWVFGLKLGLNPGLLIAVIIGLIYACSAFGLLLASWSRTRAQMQGLSIGGILLMSAIGGSMIPIFIMPEFMQNLAMFSINYWGLEGFYDILWRQSDPSIVWPKIAVLFGIGTVLLGLAYFFFRRNLARLLG
jgi:ABC-type multidrug transport system permease subunit